MTSDGLNCNYDAQCALWSGCMPLIVYRHKRLINNDLGVAWWFVANYDFRISLGETPNCSLKTLEK